MKQLRKGKSGSTVIMTSGIPAAQILRFSVPLVFGNLFQQMYSIIDAAVIGNYVGVEAFAAVGCTGWVCWLINCFFRDSANAFSIPAAICIGKKDREGFHRIVVNGDYDGNVSSPCCNTGAASPGILCNSGGMPVNCTGSDNCNRFERDRKNSLLYYRLCSMAGITANSSNSLLYPFA